MIPRDEEDPIQPEDDPAFWDALKEQMAPTPNLAYRKWERSHLEQTLDRADILTKQAKGE